jgi:hypothetical protein
LGVQIVLWVLPEKEMMMILPSASNVKQVKQRLKVPLNAIRAMLAHLAKRKVCVQHARVVFIKTTKVKQTASNAHWVNRTSIPKQCAVVVTLVRLAAVTVIVQHARLDSTKIPKVKRNAVTFASRQKKYPTKKAPAVNCHHGARAKKRNT